MKWTFFFPSESSTAASNCGFWQVFIYLFIYLLFNDIQSMSVNQSERLQTVCNKVMFSVKNLRENFSKIKVLWWVASYNVFLNETREVFFSSTLRIQFFWELLIPEALKQRNTSFFRCYGVLERSFEDEGDRFFQTFWDWGRGEVGGLVAYRRDSVRWNGPWIRTQWLPTPNSPLFLSRNAKASIHGFFEFSEPSYGSPNRGSQILLCYPRPHV